MTATGPGELAASSVLPMALETLAAIREIRPRAAALQARLRADVHGGAQALESLTHAAARGDGRARDVLIAFSWFRASQVVSDLLDALADAAPECPLFRTTTAAPTLKRAVFIDTDLHCRQY